MKIKHLFFPDRNYKRFLSKYFKYLFQYPVLTKVKNGLVSHLTVYIIRIDRSYY